MSRTLIPSAPDEATLLHRERIRAMGLSGSNRTAPECRPPSLDFYRNRAGQ